MELKTKDGYYLILKDLMPVLEDKIQKLQRRAKKLNLPTIRIEQDGEVVKKDRGRVYEFIRVRPMGDAPTLDGWEFIGTIRHTPEGNIIAVVPGSKYEAPAALRDARPMCDHCKTRRARNETYIVRNTKSRKVKQVGRSCLKDFLNGHGSPEAVTAFFSTFRSFEEFLKSLRDRSETSGRDKYLLDVECLLTFAAQVAIDDGYFVSITEARGNKDVDSTAAKALKFLHRHMDPSFERDKPRLTITKAAEQMAADIMAWVKGNFGGKSVDDMTIYEYNLTVMFALPGVKPRDVYTVISAVGAYKRTQEREVARRAEQRRYKQSQHVGKVGDRVELDLTLMKTRTVCTDYGDMHIYVFEDDAGNVLVWKTSTIMMFVTENDEQTFKPGDRLRLRATIKDHDEYNNIKQTVLARGKALAVLG
jgi:hypothetical protein